jgi:thermostable 8-oxoguanine DNA glycosylase
MQAASSSHTVWIAHKTARMALELPLPTAEVMPGVLWGCASELFTPAFWKYQVRASRVGTRSGSFRLGRSLREEIAVCLLGGHGLPAELGLAAFYRLRDRQLLRPEVEQQELESALSEPLSYEGRARRYRFPRQKAKFLWHAMQLASDASETMAPRQLRDYLTTVPGIGPKTASWIVRNHLGSDDVAILDVHILRAGMMMGIFSEVAEPTRHYATLEERFLEFCQAIDEPASLVDAMMWDHMRRIGPTASARTKVRQLELELCQ